jgi:hypothetical protein
VEGTAAKVSSEQFPKFINRVLDEAWRVIRAGTRRKQEEEKRDDD